MADFKMADQFKGLPMEDLIGGPLKAACDSQIMLANATATFIKVVGFQAPAAAALTTDPNAVGAVRTALFKFTRPQTTATAVAPGDPIPTEDVTLEVPLLSIVKIPALSITTVDITFDMEVKNSEKSVASDSKQGAIEAEAKVGWGPFSASVKISGSVSSTKENTRSTDQSAKYHVEVHASDNGMPEGLARVLDIMGSAIAPKDISSSTAATTTTTTTKAP
jgi:hypothetical protein